MQIIIDYIKENKKMLIVIFLLVAILGVASFYMNRQKEKKVYFSESYIYTKESYDHNDGLTSDLPYINIKGEDISNVNTELIKKYYEIITINEQIMKYDYYENGNILSLIIKFYYKESPDSYPSDVLFYNIDINEGKIITNDQLLRIFNISREEVSEIISSELKEYYSYELRNGYIGNDCDFNCYLSNTQILPILDDCNYYVKNNYLIAYKNINLDNKFFYDINSGFNLFNFRIKEK